MPNLLIFLAAASCLIWFWLILFHDNFWRADQKLANTMEALDDWPSVAVVVPARDEADVIGQTVHSLAAQDYPGYFRIVLVDDHSNDGTADAARQSAPSDKLTVVEAPPLPHGWTGKLAAMAHGVDQAAEIASEHRYLLFTDADIEHPANALRQLVLKAERDHRDLVSLMVRLYCQSFWESLLVPAFVFFFQKLYPFPAVNNDQSKVAAAAGGIMLVRRSALLWLCACHLRRTQPSNLSVRTPRAAASRRTQITSTAPGADSIGCGSGTGPSPRSGDNR